MHVQQRTRTKQLRSGIQKACSAISTHVRSIINLIITTKCTTIIIKYYRPNSLIFAFCFCCLFNYRKGVPLPRNHIFMIFFKRRLNASRLRLSPNQTVALEDSFTSGLKAAPGEAGRWVESS